MTGDRPCNFIPVQGEDTLVRATDVGMTFAAGHQALSNVSLAIRPGEFVSLVGPSGCGKSTLLRVLAGLLEPTAGTVTVGGLAPSQAGRDALKLAFVFQDPTLLPWRTVAGNIRLPLELDGVPRTEQLRAVRDSLTLIGLTSADAAKQPHMLSGGMRMRVSLARSLITNPALLLLDEPFGALDDILRQQLNEELLRLRAEKNWTAVFVTHNVSEAVFLSTRILVMSSAPGRLITDIPVPFDFPRPPPLRATPEFAALTGKVADSLREASR